ncbi:HAD family hydrolase [Sporosarcina thermotolerans]|uniref:HAD family hydrolase n=1 Tax=Sporosarcina thermotolerans TaxID=633404 RepID=A0AAW9A6J3_9BACL|nr:HAD family hydrolase [Sporosarcina thermotolerans]MDW0117166.1 HAD family hydrolase [Sporosarcina thermotolerans]WHT47338.1 HAD family hydrolase [Sporosarcina thermotolerans]
MDQLKNKVKVIFFDAGGVLFDTPIKGDDRIRFLLMERGYTKSKIDSALLKAKQINLPFITNWNEEEQYYKLYYGRIAEDLGENDLANELFHFADYAGHCRLFPEVKGVLEQLKREYKLAVISNAMPSMDWIFDRLGIRKYFDAIILSALVKTEKPGEAIYNIALNQMETIKEKCIFIDDKMENIDGAEQAGIKGIHLDRNRGDLLDLLRERNLI